MNVGLARKMQFLNQFSALGRVDAASDRPTLQRPLADYR